MKKAFLITTLSIIAVLVITTIVLSVVPAGLYNPVTADSTWITVYHKGEKKEYQPSTSTGLDKDKAQNVINGIYDLHNKSLRDNVLSTLFQGAFNFEAKVIDEDKSLSFTDVNSTYVIFHYNADGLTLQMNGKDYKYKENTDEKTVTYNALALQIIDGESYNQANLYVLNYEDSTPECEHYIKFIAHQAELYDYISALFE